MTSADESALTSGEPIVQRERRDGLVILRLNQPGRMNPLSVEMKAALSDAVAEFISDRDQRCLLLTGVGRAFCAGGDVATMQGKQQPIAARARVTQSTEGWARALIECEKPVVTAVNGPAVGAGFALAMMGDIVIASDIAFFQPGFGAMGVAADLGLAATLPRAIGVTRAKNVLMRDLRVEAAEAAEMGMVSLIVPSEDLDRRSLEIAQQLARSATIGIGLTKSLVGMAFEDSSHSFFKVEALAQALAFSTLDREEGVAAFMEKRSPNFTGR